MKRVVATFALIVAGVGVAGGLLAPKTWAKPKEATSTEKTIAKAVCILVERQHLRRTALNDTLSARVHRELMEAFDPLKMYFLAADIATFKKQEAKHDDTITEGDLTFGLTVYEIFLKRLDERVKWANEFAKEDFDFTKEGHLTLEPDAATYCKTADEAKKRWRDRIKFEVVSMIIDGKTKKEAQDRIQRRYSSISKRWHRLDNDELLEMVLNAVANSYDPHTSYLSPRSLEDFQIGINLSLDGIGALLSSEDGVCELKEIVPGGAADKDGRLKPGDRIVGVGEGKKGEIVDVMDMKLRDVVKLVRGKRGTIVRLEIIPAGTTKRVIYDMARQKIELNDRAAKGEVVESPKDENGRSHKIGVINLPSFYADTASIRKGLLNAKSATGDVKKILADFKKQGVEAVVVDLRANGGGLLSEAISLTGLFINTGPVVQVKDFDKVLQVHKDVDEGTAYDGPLVVLVSKLSASASEIFAGAIKDYGRGIIVGDSTTHGKGTVQQIKDAARPFRIRQNWGAVKLTVQQFYRVNGDSTQVKGVASDVVLPAATDHKTFSESSLDYAVEFNAIDSLNVKNLGYVKPATVYILAKKSADRSKKDRELIKLIARKKILDHRRDRKSITFTEESLRKERDELKDEDDDDPDTKLEDKKEDDKKEDDKKEDDKEGDDKEGDDKEKPKDDDTKKKKDKPFGQGAYTKEVLRITADYIDQFGATVADKNK